MGLHRAETSIAAPPEQIWEVVTSSEFSVWPGGLEVAFHPDGEPFEGSEIQTRISMPGISGIIVSRVTDCEPPYPLKTQLVGTTSLPVAPDAVTTIIEGSIHSALPELTIVNLVVDIEFRGLKRMAGKILDTVLSHTLQPGLDEMKANFESIRTQ